VTADRPVRRWELALWYALLGAGFVLLGAGGLGLLLSGADGRAVWQGGLLAYGIQLLAFLAVLFAGVGGRRFMLAWVAGTGVRFAVVLAVAIWLLRTPEHPAPAALLLSLVAFMFVLLLVEGILFRVGLRS
jgi:hypothetical protein